MKVSNRTLVLIASIVWLIAGINVLAIGLSEYNEYLTIINVILSLIVFSIFYFAIFRKMVFKHTDTIASYKENQYFRMFFVLKSFIIMAVMITLGIYLRVSGVASNHFIAVFYTGLGSALTLAGIFFGIKFVIFNKR